MRRLVCCVLFVCSAAARSVHAEPVTLVFVGQVTQVPAALAGAFAIGDAAQWEVTYDTVQTPIMASGGSAIYGQSAFTSWQGTVGSRAMGLDPASLFPQQWITRNDGGPGGVDRVGYSVNYYGTSSYFMSGDTLGGFRPWAFFSGFDLADGAVAGLSLPADGSAFESGTFAMYYRDAASDRNSSIGGRIDGVYRIAEPSTLLLLAIGAAGLAARRRLAGRGTR